MIRLLIIEDSKALCKMFTKLLTEETNFSFDIAQSYAQAKDLLEKSTYELAVTDMNLPDAKDGDTIPLLNKHNVSTIVFTSKLDEEFRKRFENSNIVDYVVKERYEDILYVIEKLKQLELNKTKTVLVVDDSRVYSSFLTQNLLLHKFTVLSCTNGKLALEILKEHPEIELIITDYHMPVMDGLALTRDIRKTRNKQSLSIVVLTTDTNSFKTSQFLKSGANDYITKPFSRDEFYARVYQNIQTVAMFENMQIGFNNNIVDMLAEITEFRNAETGSHVKRISEYSYVFSKLCGLEETEAQGIGKLATLHDIGKITIDDSILCKPAKLTTDEFDIMKTHTTNGAAILQKAFSEDLDLAKIAADIALSHHERWDGTGYPHQLKGEEIPLSARIVALVDVFDALVNKRVYKDEWNLEDTLKYIHEFSGTQFDPSLVKLFADNLDSFICILDKYACAND